MPLQAGLVMRARVVVALMLVGYTGVLLTWVLPGPAVTAVDDLGQLAAALAAAGCCARASRCAPAGRARWSWWLLAGGTGSWAAGQAVWSFSELAVGRAVPFPSLADAGFLLFPLLAGVGLLVLPVGRDAAWSGARNLLDAMVIAGSLLILSWASSLGATVADEGSGRLATVLAVAYPLGDVVVLTLVVLVLSRAASGRRAVLVPLAVGLASLAAADSSFLYLTATGSYATGDLCGVGWTAGFVLVALAALAACASGSDISSAPGPGGGVAADRWHAPTQVVLPSRARLLLPYLCPCCWRRPSSRGSC